MSLHSLRMDTLGSLQGRIALVTGAGTGMYVGVYQMDLTVLNCYYARGLMIAKGFAANGAKVYVAGRRIDILEKSTCDVENLMP
jgi:NAD(P)-dependent dehydrogenase (short-subunit alcohol dehydrogenase family)